MNKKNFWIKKLKKHDSQSWAHAPSLFAEQVMEYLPSKGKLLELGAGVGADGILFAENGFTVIQSDLIDVGLRDKYRGKNIKQINFIQHDLNSPLPWDGQEFDVVYACLSLHYFDLARTRALLKEIKTVLKPGGIFASLWNSKQDVEYQNAKETIEDGFIQDGEIAKRYTSSGELRELMNDFSKILVCDDLGIAKKDLDKGNNFLVRAIVKR